MPLQGTTKHENEYLTPPLLSPRGRVGVGGPFYLCAKSRPKPARIVLDFDI